MRRKCATCGTKVPGGLLQCPKCGRGIFVSEEMEQLREEKIRREQRQVSEDISKGSSEKLINDTTDAHADLIFAMRESDPDLAKKALSKKVTCASCKNTFVMSEGLNVTANGSYISVICPNCKARTLGIAAIDK